MSTSPLSITAPLRVAVVGAGIMGGNHARVLSRLPGIVVAAIVDPDAERGRAMAELHGCPWQADSSGLAGRVEAVTIASSSSTHHSVARQVLADGIPCLVEKPMALSEADCLELIEAAKAKDVPLAVGHVERFNPAVTKARELLRGQQIHAIDGRRLNPGSNRILDADVVEDLMVHDLDAVLAIMGAVPDSVSARGVAVARPGIVDHATALLGYGGRSSVVLTASRIADVRVRELQIQSGIGMVTVNYLSQEVLVTRARGQDFVTEKIFVRQGEPLALELGSFLDGVRAGRTEGATGSDGLAALRLVWAVQAGLKRAA